MFFLELLHFLHLVIHLWAWLSHLVPSEMSYISSWWLLLFLLCLSLSALCIGLLFFHSFQFFSCSFCHCWRTFFSPTFSYLCLLLFCLSFSFDLASSHLLFKFALSIDFKTIRIQAPENIPAVCSTMHRTSQSGFSLSRSRLDSSFGAWSMPLRAEKFSTDFVQGGISHFNIWG